MVIFRKGICTGVSLMLIGVLIKRYKFAVLTKNKLVLIKHELGAVTVDSRFQSVEFLEKFPPLLFGVAKQGGGSQNSIRSSKIFAPSARI